MKKLALTISGLICTIAVAHADGYAYNNFGPGYSFNYGYAWAWNTGDTIGFQFTSSLSGGLRTIRTGMTNWMGDTQVELLVFTDNGNKPWSFLGAAFANLSPGSWMHQVPPTTFDLSSSNALILAGHKYWVEAYTQGYNRWNMNTVGAQSLLVGNGIVEGPVTQGAFSVWLGPIPT